MKETKLFIIKKKGTTGKKWLIIRTEDKKIVGRSDKRAKAMRSIGYRMEAIAQKNKEGRLTKTNYK